MWLSIIKEHYNMFKLVHNQWDVFKYVYKTVNTWDIL